MSASEVKTDGKDTSSADAKAATASDRVDRETAWKRLSASGPQRTGHTAVLYRDSMIVFGGEDEKGTLHNDVHAFSLDKSAWSKLSTTGDAPSGRTGHSAVVHGSSMYVFGGATDNKSSALSGDLFVLSLGESAFLLALPGSPAHLRGLMQYRQAGVEQGLLVGQVSRCARQAQRDRCWRRHDCLW